VAARPILSGDPLQGRNDFLRWFAVGIPQGKIKDVFFPALPFHSVANLKHAPDPGGVFHLLRNSFANTH
jgi:hypothetical protein